MFGLDSLAPYVSLLKMSLVYIFQFFRLGMPTNPVGIFCLKFNPSIHCCQLKFLGRNISDFWKSPEISDYTDYEPITQIRRNWN